jgi:hypothetical protein
MEKNRSVYKAARLIILLDLADARLLEGLSLQQIADMFGDAPNRSTILRDLRQLPKLRKAVAEMRKKLTAKAKT